MRARAQTAAAVLKGRIQVRLDDETIEAITKIFDDTEADEGQRCEIIRDLLKVGLGKKPHVLVFRLGALSDEELKTLSANAESVSSDCGRVVNALRDLQTLDAHQEIVAEEWRACIRSCIKTQDAADQLVADIRGKVRSRVDPPQFVIATIMGLIKQLRQEVALTTDATVSSAKTSRLKELESYLRSIEPSPRGDTQ